MGPVVAFAPLADGACVLLLRVPLPATTRHGGAKVSNFLIFPINFRPTRRFPDVKHLLHILPPPEEPGSMLDSVLV
jgi:hypothetical protein